MELVSKQEKEEIADRLSIGKKPAQLEEIK